MACCKNPVLIPIVYDGCTGQQRQLRYNESIRVGDSLEGWYFMYVTGTPVDIPFQKNFIVLADDTDASITLNLPPVEKSKGQWVVVKKVSDNPNTVTVDGNGSETIDGATTAELANQYDSIIIVCDGVEWHTTTSGSVGGGGGGGDVGATDNRVVRTDGTSGDTIQGSSATLTDDNHFHVELVGSTRNIAIGASTTMAGSLSGANNVAIGAEALEALTSGSNNVALGYNSLSGTGNPDSNVAIGVNALASATGDDSVAIGLNAGNGMDIGSGEVAANVFIGHGSGYVAGGNQSDAATGCVCIGRSTAGGGDNAFALGNAVIAGKNYTQINARGFTTSLTDDLQFSTVVGGLSNTHTSTGASTQSRYCFMGGGFSNSITSPNTSAYYCALLGGRGNDIIDCSYATIVGGLDNVINGSLLAAIVGGDSNNIANGADGSVVLGGVENSVLGAAQNSLATGADGEAALPNSHVHGGGSLTEVGDAQYIRLVLRRQTTDNSTVSLLIDGVTNLTMQDNSAWMCRCDIVAQNDDGSEAAGYTIIATFKKDGAANPVLVGSTTVTEHAEDDASWSVAASTSGANPFFSVTGVSATAINWVATLHITQVKVQS